MTNRTPINLVNFFVFNATFGPKEGEEEKKIIFYFPKSTDIDTQIKSVGLCQAICKFTETFSDKPCQSLHTQKQRQIFYEPEKEFWIIMTVSIPSSERTKDGQVHTEYHDEDVQDSVYEAVLIQAYRMFQLFNGTFEHIIQRSDVAGLQQRLEHFYARYLWTIKMPQSDILDIFNGIHFLPLDKNTYLRIQCFVNLLEATFPCIKYTAFLYNDQLVWSGLEQDDMRIMYKYLTTSLFPNTVEQELQSGHAGSSQRANPSSVDTRGHYGKYITGPPNIHDETNMGKIPHVYVNTQKLNEQCYLLVYRAHSATVCLLINVSFVVTFEFLKKVDAFLGPRLTTLASDISEQYSKETAVKYTETQYRYIYFNHMNLAQKTTVHTDDARSSNIHIPAETMKLLCDINSDLTKDEDGETIVKTLSDCWVVSKKSDQREFYVVINQKNANLIEINEEVKRLCATNFNSIFFLD